MTVYRGRGSLCPWNRFPGSTFLQAAFRKAETGDGKQPNPGLEPERIRSARKPGTEREGGEESDREDKSGPNTGKSRPSGPRHPRPAPACGASRLPAVFDPHRDRIRPVRLVPGAAARHPHPHALEAAFGRGLSSHQLPHEFDLPHQGGTGQPGPSGRSRHLLRGSRVVLYTAQRFLLLDLPDRDPLRAPS